MALALLVVIFAITDVIFPVDLSRYRDISVSILDKNQKPLHIFHTRDEKWRMPTATHDVNSLYLETLILREDRYFKKHVGVNPVALLRALGQRIRYGRVISGGSTITMQTARLLEPRPRTIRSKLIECFRALQLEWHFSKAEILNIYMTLAPLGGNVEGVNAAAWAYFKKSPQQLTPAEVALLVAMVQSPTRLHPIHFPERALKARLHILTLMQKEGLITANEAALAANAPLPVTVKQPKEIPHLAWRLKNLHPTQPVLVTSVDMPLQKQVEQLLQNYAGLLPSGANAAILILDHIHNKPLVYVASRNYLDADNSGFVDYICASRSPGSTLKPFIYGLAFDMGILQPTSLVLDDRQRFGAYMPRNFDKDIHGVVPVSEALSLSLNIPVVALLNEIGVVRFIGILKEAGIEPKFPHSIEGPSLATALGGLGLSLEQLVSLYAVLARQGEVKPFSYIEATPSIPTHQMLSKRAAMQITDILTEDNVSPFLAEDLEKISLKTGTSFGHRDALAIAYDSQYVVGIWIGMPDGSRMGSVTGRSLAVPLTHKIFQLLPKQRMSHKTHVASPELQLKPVSASANHRAALHKERPQLLFPVNDTVVELEKDKVHFKPIPLVVSGGKRPYTWMVDDEPIEVSCWQQKRFWTPEKPGYYTISVVDANGQSERANIEVR
ncbi:MAG: penicillin-binding protein 1C [Gammaproteobacteria bacterium 39-13]|nr:MAG: penicillin-binding protein 1C [Gammaproteobacteria bacterium 39-13]